MNVIQNIRAWVKRPNKSTVAQYVETLIVILPLAFIIRTFFYGLYQVPTGSMEVTMLVGERFFADKFSIWFYPPQRGEIIAFNTPTFPYSENRFKRLFEQYIWGPENWTKRVIAIPGDHIKGVIEDGKPVVYLNGEKLEEPYINPYPLISVYREGTMPPWVIRSYDPKVSYEQQPFYSMSEHNVERAKRILRYYGEQSMRYPHTPVQCQERSVDEYDIHLGENQYWVMGDNRQGSGDSRFWGALDGSLIHGKITFRLISIDSNESWLILDILKHPLSFWSRVRWSRFFQRVY